MDVELALLRLVVHANDTTGWTRFSFRPSLAVAAMGVVLGSVRRLPGGLDEPWLNLSTGPSSRARSRLDTCRRTLRASLDDLLVLLRDQYLFVIGSLVVEAILEVDRGLCDEEAKSDRGVARPLHHLRLRRVPSRRENRHEEAPLSDSIRDATATRPKPQMM